MRSELLLSLLVASSALAIEDPFPVPARGETEPLRPPPPSASAPEREAAPPAERAKPLRGEERINTNRPAGEGPEDPPPPKDAEDIRAESYLYSKPKPPRRVEGKDGMFVTPGDKVDANDALQEIVDEFAADIARMGANSISPILVNRIAVSDNVNPDFVRVLEARLVSAIFRAARVSVVKCIECNAVLGRIENGAYVVTQGFSSAAELKRIARSYNAQVILDGTLTLQTAPNSMSLDVQLIRAEDASIAFAERYWVHPYTAMLHRSADRPQVREERLKDLEDRINARPRFNNSLHLGVTVVPSDHPDGVIWASVLGFRFMEIFGDQREWRIGGDIAVMINPLRLTAALPMLQVQRRITPDNVYLPTCHVGAGGGMFVSGLEGNSPAFTANGDCVFAHRIGLRASLNFIIPTQLGGAGGYFAGGFSPHVGAAYQW